MTRSSTRVLLLVPYFNKEGVGEDYSNYKLIEGLSERYTVTVLTIARPGHEDRLRGLAAELVEFADSRLHLALVRSSERYARFSREACPNYLRFYRKARAWILANGHRFALIHQFSPLALRYPTPALAFLRGNPTPFLAGPLGGALATPRQLRRFPWIPERSWIDRTRFRLDPLLRSTFSRADCLIGAGPYVQSLLHSVPLRRFECMSEMGIERLGPSPAPRRPGQPFRLLFVGRLVPTKGVLQAIRCLGQLDDLPFVDLTIAGVGPLADECRRLVSRLGLESRVHMLGRLSRSEVFERYREAHAFLFPSYREPTGHVVYEAMSFGLPVITTNVGGPAHIVSDEAGFRIAPAPSPRFERDLAAAVRRIVSDEALRARLCAAAQRRIAEVALWPTKIDFLQGLYESTLGQTGAR